MLDEAVEVIKVWFSSFRQLIKMINELFCESRKTWLICNINEDNRIYYERHELELYAALKIQTQDFRFARKY